MDAFWISSNCILSVSRWKQIFWPLRHRHFIPESFIFYSIKHILHAFTSRLIINRPIEIVLRFLTILNRELIKNHQWCGITGVVVFGSKTFPGGFFCYGHSPHCVRTIGIWLAKIGGGVTSTAPSYLDICRCGNFGIDLFSLLTLLLIPNPCSVNGKANFS